MKKNVRKVKEYNNNWPIVAICYDFDKTLSPKDMQDFGLIPKLNCDISSFWKESNERAAKEGMDRILSYMRLIIDKASQHGVTVSESDFKKLGKSIVLFPGVESWFQRINAYAESIRINLEHYIISAGLKEIIAGTSIAKYFTEIYASSFIYTEYGAPFWPRQVVNYTTKTQHLFRISKNCLDLSDESRVNEYIKSENRRIPFKNFIYIGDSETDIPAMRVVKKGGGTSIGVYNSETANIGRAAKLLMQERIDYLVPAVYEENSRLDVLVKDTLKRIKSQESLATLHKQQNEYVDRICELEYLIDYTKRYLQDDDYELDDLQNIQKQAKQIFRDLNRELLDDFAEMVTEDEIKKIVEEKKALLNDMFNKKKRSLKDKTKRLNSPPPIE